MLTAEIQRFQGDMRSRWSVRLRFLDGEPESYGATLQEALLTAAEFITAENEEQARAALDGEEEDG